MHKGEAVGGGGGEHARRHHRKAAEDDGPPAEAVGKVADQHRSHRHAEQLHRQHDAERGAVDIPFVGDPRRGKTDRQHVEAIERVQRDAERDDHDLQGTHRRRCHGGPDILAHILPPNGRWTVSQGPAAFSCCNDRALSAL